MNAYDKIYLERARSTLGCMLDYGVNALGYKIHEFWNMFLLSDISKRFQSGGTSLITGKSGVELAFEVANKEVEQANTEVSEEKSPEYWAGWALAYYQWKTGLTFACIEESVPIDNIVMMYFPYHEMDIRQFCDRMDEITKSGRSGTNLKRIRKSRGLTQSQLAEQTNVPLRTIQQYEQGQKSINSARSDYVIAFSKALYCSPEELLEPV